MCVLSLLAWKKIKSLDRWRAAEDPDGAEGPENSLRVLAN